MTNQLPLFSFARLCLGIVLLLAMSHLSVLAQSPIQLTNSPANPTPGAKVVEKKSVRVVNGKLYFRATTSTGVGAIPYKPFVSDGTPEGTRQLTSLPANEDVNFTAYNGRVYFVVPYSAATPSRSLYVTDGTEAGTTLVRTFTGRFSSAREGLIVANGKLYFSFFNESTRLHDLWVSDGTSAGSILLTSTADRSGSSSTFFDFTSANSRLYFIAEDSSLPTFNALVLWVTDGTPAGTRPLSNVLGVSTGGPNPKELTNVGNKLFYAFAGPCGNITGLWITDNTVGGTFRVKGGVVIPGTMIPFFPVGPTELTAGPDNKLIFRASG